MSAVTEVSGKQQFDQLVSTSEKVVLVDFRASRCGPCRML